MSKKFLDIQAALEGRFTLKRVRDMLITYSCQQIFEISEPSHSCCCSWQKREQRHWCRFPAFPPRFPEFPALFPAFASYSPHSCHSLPRFPFRLLQKACKILHYEKSSISVSQEIFASADKIFIPGGGLCAGQ